VSLLNLCDFIKYTIILKKGWLFLVSIIMLVHNAATYIKKSIKSLKMTTNISYELIVIDNASDMKTKKLLFNYKSIGYITKLFYSDKNLFYAKGNNIGLELCSPDSKYILLLNSDVEILDSDWLYKLKSIMPKGEGAASFGVCLTAPIRADGFCFLIQKDIYAYFKLDENFEWWWSLTKLQGNMLKNNYPIVAVRNFNNIIKHYGGSSGDSWKTAKGMDIKRETILSWFPPSKSIKIIDAL
jgi:glycosyltransferase involved in cell wall biosynthesis